MDPFVLCVPALHTLLGNGDVLNFGPPNLLGQQTLQDDELPWCIKPLHSIIPANLAIVAKRNHGELEQYPDGNQDGNPTVG